MFLKKLLRNHSSSIAIGFILFFFSFIGFCINYHADDIYISLFYKTHHGISAIFERLKMSYYFDNGRIGQYLSIIYYYFFGVKSSFYAFLLPLLQLTNLILFFTFIFGRVFHFKKKEDIKILFFLFLLYVLGTSSSSTIFWIAGAFNHSFPLIFLFSFLIPFRFLLRKENSLSQSNFLKMIWFLLCAFLAGLNYETLGVTVPLFCILCLFSFFIQNKKKKKSLFIFVVGIFLYLLGFLLLITTPGTHNRAIEEGHIPFNIHNILVNLFIRGYLGHSYVTIAYFTLSLFMIFYFLWNKGWKKQFYARPYFIVFFFTIFFSLTTVFPMIFSNTSTIHQANGYFIASLIAMIGVIYFCAEFHHLFIGKKINPLLKKTSLTVGLLACFCLLFSYDRVYKITQEGFNILNENRDKNTDVTIPIVHKSVIAFPFQIYFIDSLDSGISGSNSIWNKDLALLYGVKSITAVPKKLW